MISTTANRIRELREAKGLQRYELASVVRRTEQTVGRWERGESAIPEDCVWKLANYFAVAPAYLVGWDGRKKGQAA